MKSGSRNLANLLLSLGATVFCAVHLQAQVNGFGARDEKTDAEIIAPFQPANETNPPAPPYPQIQAIDPPENGFFTKVLFCRGIPIKAPAVVADEAMYRAYDRLAMETARIPMAVSNIAAAGGQLHIIGRNQVTTDLPEWRQDKHVPLYEPTYNGQTRDQRTRGMGGTITSCGEENLLNLPADPYRGSDICLHEFAHNIEDTGMGRAIRAQFDAQYQRSREKGLWLGSYAGSNPNEYFAELTMWYFNSHGSFGGFQGPRPGPGAEGLKQYDPEAFALFDQFYSGKMDIPRMLGGGGRRAPPAGEVGANRTPAGKVVGRLNSYIVGETSLSQLYADAGMGGPADAGKNGWVVAPRNSSRLDPSATNSAAAAVRVSFHHETFGDASIADLDFQDGVLSAFKWNN
ncbi:MAG: hypothetical protein ABSA47_01780 [Verrucomicrobiota bacterium]|jgi:hypothetical protein